MMNLYEMIKNDQVIIDRYQQIEQSEILRCEVATHGLSHVERVANRMEELLAKLGYDAAYIQAAKITAIMHDAGCLNGKSNHAQHSYEFAKQYFADNKIIPDYQEDILEAIQVHSDGFNTTNMIAQTLVFSDKLDITSDRLGLGGYYELGMRQLQYIKEIQVKIIDRELIIRFMTDTNFQKKELDTFYFMKKVYRAIESFANQTQLSAMIQFETIDQSDS